MKGIDLKLNMRLEIGITVSQRTEYVPVRVEGVSADLLTVSMPMWQGALVPLRAKDKLVVRLFYRDSYLGFETVVVERRLKPVPVVVVERPQKIYPLGQRRRHVRVATSLTVGFRLLSDNNNDFSAHVAQSINISAGGMLIATDIPLKLGQTMLLEISLPMSETITCKAKTVRVYSEADGLVKCRVGIEYEDIAEKDRDRIARYVFNKQREMIKKGLLEG